MKYHAFQRATQAELRVRVACRGAFSALKFPSTMSIDNEAEKGQRETQRRKRKVKFHDRFLFDRFDFLIGSGWPIDPLSFFFFFNEHGF